MAERPILFSSEMVRAILDGRKFRTRRTRNLNVINEQPNMWEFLSLNPSKQGLVATFRHGVQNLDARNILCPYGSVGDLLWVRETIMHFGNKFVANKKFALVKYKSDETSAEILHQNPPVRDWWNNKYTVDGKKKRQWITGRFTPKWAARIWLEITNIRVERVQDITQEDVISEGVLIPTNDKNNPYLRLTGKYPPHDYWSEGTMSKGKWPPEILKMDEFIKAHFASLWDSINAKRGYSWEKNPYVWVIEFRQYPKETK